jgi:hypothetical protein
VNYPQIWGNVFQGEITRRAHSRCLPVICFVVSFRHFSEAKNIWRRNTQSKLLILSKEKEILFLKNTKKFQNFLVQYERPLKKFPLSYFEYCQNLTKCIYYKLWMMIACSSFCQTHLRYKAIWFF